MKLQVLVISMFIVCVTESLMSMDMHSELVTKAQFLVNQGKIEGYALFAKKNKLCIDCGYKGQNFVNTIGIDYISMNTLARACNEAAAKGQGKALLTSATGNGLAKDYITKISSISVANESIRSIEDGIKSHFLITMKPSPF